MKIIAPQRVEMYFNGNQITQRFHQWITDINDRQTLESDGSPEGIIEATKLALCIDTTNDNLYYKSTETGNTGWILL